MACLCRMRNLKPQSGEDWDGCVGDLQTVFCRSLLGRNVEQYYTPKLPACAEAVCGGYKWRVPGEDAKYVRTYGCLRGCLSSNCMIILHVDTSAVMHGFCGHWWKTSIETKSISSRQLIFFEWRHLRIGWPRLGLGNSTGNLNFANFGA
jgi:hypothetical protein